MKLQRKGEFLSTRVQYIPLGRIRPNPQQPRQGFDEVGLAELAASIRAAAPRHPLLRHFTAADGSPGRRRV